MTLVHIYTDESMKKPTADSIVVDNSRDALLTVFGKETLSDRYLAPGETFQGMFARVAAAYADDQEHAQRIYDYISKHWFMPATPVLSNGGLQRGLPISCFLNTVEDSIDSIVSVWNENVALATNGGGIGTYWGKVRSIGEKVKGAGQTSGIIPFIRVMDSLTLAISQGSLRRGSAAVYIDVFHPEIEEFLEIRKPSGDFNRKSLNLHHGINITDEFMLAVYNGEEFALRSPKTNEAIKYIDARYLWQKILETRLQTGEPYLIFTDTVNAKIPEFQKLLNYNVKQSNLCSEIVLHTGKDYLNEERTAVCCLSSVNAIYFNEWKDDPNFIEDVMRFLDNVLEDFIQNAESRHPNFKAAVHAAFMERSVGLGVMGFHTLLQNNKIPFGSAMAKSWNFKIFKHLKREADAASQKLAIERGPCPDWVNASRTGYKGAPERFSHKLAIAPTASISIICGGASAGIEPIPANVYLQKTLTGTAQARNPNLAKIINDYAADLFAEPAATQWADLQWDSILANEGSVQHLEWMNPKDKEVFLTAFEIDQRWVIELAADRTDYVCQSQSINVFLPSNIDKWDLHMLHFTAWERKCKSLYYVRSKSIQRASHAGEDFDIEDIIASIENPMAVARKDYDECLSCQ